MTQILFIRHGETDWNRRHCFQGQLDTPLNATGHAQAARMAARLADEKPDAFFCSDLQRTRETAAPLARAWGFEPTHHIGLREQAFGVFEGLEVRAIVARHGDLWQRWLEHRADYGLPGGGESMRAFSARVLDAVNTLMADCRGSRVTVVTHGGVLDVLWRHAHGLALDGGRECLIPNTGLNRLRWGSGGTLVIEDWADASHLDGSQMQI